MEQKKNFRIAFLTSGDARSRRLWSGTPYYMAQALQKHVGEVHYLGPVNLKRKIIGKAVNKICSLFLRKTYDHTHSIFWAKGYARAFLSRLEEGVDLIFAPAASGEIAFLETKIPVVYTSDATFALINNYYPGFHRLLKRSVYEGNLLEQAAIKKSSLLLYPTQWAAKSALSDYGAGEGKVFVVPYGANLDKIPERAAVLQKRKSERCRLLFLGVNWERKGGEIAYDTLLEMKKLGLPAELVVCGCIPPKKFIHPRLTVIPFLDKNREGDSQKLFELLANSDFLLLPTRYECLGIVFFEANAFGLPAITADTGGVSSSIRDGENGFVLPYEARGEEYARLIAEIYRDERRYQDLAQASRRAFEEKFNWDVWAQTVKKLLREKLGLG